MIDPQQQRVSLKPIVIDRYTKRPHRRVERPRAGRDRGQRRRAAAAAGPEGRDRGGAPSDEAPAAIARSALLWRSLPARRTAGRVGRRCGRSCRSRRRCARPIRSGPSPARIEPRYKTDLGFRIFGRMVARFVDVGAVVKKGEELAALDPAVQALAVRNAEAAVANAEAQFANAAGRGGAPARPRPAQHHAAGPVRLSRAQSRDRRRPT